MTSEQREDELAEMLAEEKIRRVRAEDSLRIAYAEILKLGEQLQKKGVGDV